MPSALTRSASAIVHPPLFGGGLVLLGLLISIWFAGFRVPPSDAGALLTGASKILQGGVFYRDVDAYPFPGSHYLLALVMGLFGEHLSAARGLATLFFLVTLASLYGIALQLLSRSHAAAFGLAVLSFKFLAWPGFTAYVYWDVAFAFACVSIALFLRHDYAGPSLRLFGAGLFAGLALVSKQNVGIYLAGASGVLLLFARPLLAAPARTLRQSLLEATVFSAAVLAPLLLMGIFFAAHGLLFEMIYGGLIRPFVGYLPTSGVSFFEPLQWWALGSWGSDSGIQYLPEPYLQMLRRGILPGAGLYPVYWLAGELFSRLLYTLVPVGFVSAFVLWWKSKRSGAARNHSAGFAFVILALSVLGSAFPRADYTHLISVYPLVLLVLIWVWDQALSSNEGSHLSQTGGLPWAVSASLLLVCGALSVVHHSHLSQRRMQLDRADLYVYPDSWVESVVRYVQAELEPGDPLFVYGNDAHYYFLTGHYFPWRFSQLYPGQVGGNQGKPVVELLVRERPPLVVRGILNWPGLPPMASYAGYVDRYIQDRYVRVGHLFDRYPLPGGASPPPAWVISVLRRVSGP